MRAEDLWTQESNRAQAATALASLARLDSQAGDAGEPRTADFVFFVEACVLRPGGFGVDALA
jgi:hypothetical protein